MNSARSSPITVAAFAALSFTTPATAQWTKVFDTSTPLPGETRAIYNLSEPAISNGNVVFATEFEEFSGQWQAIYARIDGQLVKIIDDQTSFPGQPQNFGGLYFSPLIDNNQIAFHALAADFWEEGIFTWTAGQLSKIADTQTTIPNTSVPFFTFGAPHLRKGSVVFSGVEEEADASGVYTNRSRTLQPVADFGAPLPGGGGTFTGFPYLLRSETILADGRVVFLARTSKPAPSGSVFAIFSAGPDGIQTLVEEQTTPMPGDAGVFRDLRRVFADDDGSLAFEGLGDAGRRGIYTLRDGLIRAVFDNTTPIPGGTGNFSFAHRQFVETLFSYDTGGVLFEGFGDNDYRGIFYATPYGLIVNLLDVNSSLDGKGVSDAFIERGSLDGSSAALWVLFEDGSQGIYTTPVPGPIPGDADFSGAVDADDYARTDRGFLDGLSGWGNGDFNADGVVNISDYFLIDRTLLTQPPPPAGAASVPEPISLLPLLAALTTLRRRRS